MKNLFFAWLAFSFVLIAVTAVAGDSGNFGWDEETVALGERLFNDPNLGGSTNELSCSACHSGGVGLEYAAELSHLNRAIKHCLRYKMEGRIERGDPSMLGLHAYVLSLSGTGESISEPEEPLTPENGPVKGWEKNKSAGWVPPGSVQSISGAQAEESESRGSKQTTGKK